MAFICESAHVYTNTGSGFGTIFCRLTLTDWWWTHERTHTCCCGRLAGRARAGRWGAAKNANNATSLSSVLAEQYWWHDRFFILSNVHLLQTAVMNHICHVLGFLKQCFLISDIPCRICSSPWGFASPGSRAGPRVATVPPTPGTTFAPGAPY